MENKRSFKQTKEEQFAKILETIEDEKYKEWLIKNKGTFICRPKTQRKAYLDALEEFGKSDTNLQMPQFYKGEIYFADLAPESSGKIRPVLIYQNDKLNKAVRLNLYHTVVVMPLTSRLLGGDYRVKIKARENLIKTSEIVCNALGIVSADRILFKKQKATSLTKKELEEVENRVKKLFDIF